MDIMTKFQGRRMSDFLTSKRRGRNLFFVSYFFELDCLTSGCSTYLAASRYQAKKIGRYIAHRSLSCERLSLSIAWQRDLHFSGWTIDKRRRPPSLEVD